MEGFPKGVDNVNGLYELHCIVEVEELDEDIEKWLIGMAGISMQIVLSRMLRKWLEHIKIIKANCR